MVRTTRSVRTRIHKSSSGCAVKLKAGSLLVDSFQQKWVLGSPIAAGGFGDIHLVSRDFRKNNSGASYVAKVELVTSGPLFVEMNFYLRVGKETFIDKWKKERGVTFLGMPHLIAFGSHPANDTRYRFIIINRCGPDIWSLFLKNYRRFSLKSTLSLAIQIINVLEYIHFYGYVHADIKGANLVLELGKGGGNRAYLIDFGLARMYVDVQGRHKEFVQDWRRAHNGTLEYTSRDAHVGAHSRRGDFEILGYNLVQWLCGELPWESDMEDSDTVAAAKNMYMANPKLFMAKCFPRGGPPAVIQEYIQYVAKMTFTTKPDYEGIRNLFRKGLEAAGLKDDGKLQLTESITRVNAEKRGLGSNTENCKRVRQPANPRRTMQHRKPCTPVELRCTRLRSAIQTKDFDWVKVLQSHPERDARLTQASLKKTSNSVLPLEDLDESVIKTLENPLDNPTPAMLHLLERKRLGKQRHSRADCSPSPQLNGQVLTPAMEEVIRSRLARGSNYQPPVTAMCTRADRTPSRRPSPVHDPPPPASPPSPPPSPPSVCPSSSPSICPPSPPSPSPSPTPQSYLSHAHIPWSLMTMTRLRTITRVNYRELTPEKDWEKIYNAGISDLEGCSLGSQREVAEILPNPSDNSDWRPPTPPRRSDRKRNAVENDSDDVSKRVCGENDVRPEHPAEIAVNAQGNDVEPANHAVEATGSLARADHVSNEEIVERKVKSKRVRQAGTISVHAPKVKNEQEELCEIKTKRVDRKRTRESSRILKNAEEKSRCEELMRLKPAKNESRKRSSTSVAREEATVDCEVELNQVGSNDTSQNLKLKGVRYGEDTVQEQKPKRCKNAKYTCDEEKHNPQAHKHRSTHENPVDDDASCVPRPKRVNQTQCIDAQKPKLKGARSGNKTRAVKPKRVSRREVTTTEVVFLPRLRSQNRKVMSYKPM